MADGVAWRLRAAGLKAATITLKLRDSSFATITRQTTLDEPADLTEPIYEAALVLLRRELHGQRIRLVGVTASNFRDREQLALFETAEDPKRHQAAEAMDSIRRRYGERAVTRARLRAGGAAGAVRARPDARPSTRPPAGAAAPARGAAATAGADDRAGDERDSLGDTDDRRGSRRRRLTSNTCSV